MTTPRQTFEDYNPYPPVKPVPPPPPIPPKTQKLIDVRKWTNEPMSQEYERGLLNPNVNFWDKITPFNFIKNTGDVALSFAEWDPPTEFLKPIYDPQRLDRNKPLGKLLETYAPSEFDRKMRQTNMLSVMAEEGQKEFARESIIGEDLATRSLWRSLPKILDNESLMFAAPFAMPGKIGSMIMGPTYHALKGLKTVPKPNPNTYLSSTASKTGGNSFVNKTNEIVKNIVKPLSGELGVLERTPKNILRGVGAVGKAFAEPIIPNNPMLSAGAELYADLSIEAAMAAGSDAKKYNDSSGWGAFGTGALTFTGLAAGALSPKFGPNVYRLATKSSDKLMNAMKAEQVYAYTGSNREGRSNIVPKAQADLNSWYTHDKNTFSIDGKKNLYNIDEAHTETIVNKNIQKMLSDQYASPKDIPDRRIIDNESTYYPANKLKEFKNTIYKMSPDIRDGGYEEGLYKDIEFERLWQSSIITKNNQKVVDLKGLQSNLSNVERDMLPTIVDFDGVGNDTMPTIDSVVANIEMIKAYYNPDTSKWNPSTNRDKLNLYNSELLLQKVFNTDNIVNETMIKPLIKYDIEHTKKTYDLLPEEEKVIIRGEFQRKFEPLLKAKQTERGGVIVDHIDEEMFKPIYWFQPKVLTEETISGKKQSFGYFGREALSTSDRAAAWTATFESKTLDELLDNSYMKIFALSKLLRTHKTYFKSSSNYSHIQDLINKKQLRFTPIESDVHERNMYYGFNKLIDPEYGVTDNANVKEGLNFLKTIFDQQISIQDRNGLRKISPYFEFPDTMLWGNKHTQWSAGNNKALQDAIDLDITIPIHGGAGQSQFFNRLEPLGGAFKQSYTQGLTPTAMTGKSPNQRPLYSLHRLPSIFGKGIDSPRRDPDADFLLGAMSATEYANNFGHSKGIHIATRFGGWGLDEEIEEGIRHLVDSGWKEQDAVNHILKDNINYSFEGELLDEYGVPIRESTSIESEYSAFDKGGTKTGYEFVKDQLTSSTYILKANPNSTSSKLGRTVSRLNISTGFDKNGIPFVHNKNHLEKNADAINWARTETWSTNFVNPKTGTPKTIKMLTEIQRGTDYPSEQFHIDIETGHGQMFETFEPMSKNQQVKIIEESLEFAEKGKPEILNQADLDRAKYGASVDRPLIGGSPSTALQSIFSMIRPSHYSKTVINNFDENARLIETNSELLNRLDTQTTLLDKDISTYSSWKSVSDINKNPLKILKLTDEDQAISYTGGLSKAIDEDTKAFAFASLEYYLKSVIAPFASQAYKDGKRAIKIKKAGGFVSEGETIIKPLKFIGGGYSALKELLEDMGYEKLHDWENWKARDWILENNKNGTLGKKLLNLFRYLEQKPSALKLKITGPFERQGWSELDFDVVNEFGDFGLHESGGLIKFRSSPPQMPLQRRGEVSPWVKESALLDYLDSPVNKELYEYYTTRFRAQTYTHTSNYINEPRRMYLTVKHFIQKAIEEGHDWLMIPTAKEISIRNGMPEGLYTKAYDKRLPSAIKLLMREQYGIDLKIDDKFFLSLPTAEEVPLKQIEGLYEDNLNKESTLFQFTDKSMVMKIPQKLKDNWEKTKQHVEGPLYKRVDGEIKGAVDFRNDGRALIRAFEKADLNTAIHEIAHVLRRDLDDDELKIVNDYFGIKDGEWTRDAEEKFANALEDFYINKKVPNPSLLTPFTKLLKKFAYLFRTKVWAKISGSKEGEFTEILEDLLKDIPDNEASRTFLDSDEMVAVTVKMADSFNITVDEARGVMATIQGRALAWADETGKDPSDWWKERGVDIADGDLRTLNDFKRLNTDHIDEETLDGFPNIIGGQKFAAALDKLIDLVRKAPKVRHEIEAAQQEKRKKAVGKAYETLYRSADGAGNSDIDNPQITLRNARAKLGGTGIKNTAFEPIAEYSDDGLLVPRITDTGEEATPLLGDEINTLFTELELQVRANKLRFFDWLNTYDALTNILTGLVPNNYQINLLEKAFGIEGKRLGMLARKHRSVTKKTFSVLDDVLFQSIVAIKSSWDLSAPLRQAFFISIQPQKWNVTIPAYAKMVGSFLSGTRTRLLYKTIETDPYFEMFEKAGLEIIEADSLSQIDEYKRLRDPKERELGAYFDTELDAVGEEVFGGGQATFVKMFPILGQTVKMSERAYSTYLNLIRFDRLKNNYLMAKRKGYIHKMDPELKKPPTLDEKGNIIPQAVEYFTPEERGYRELTDFEMISMADLVNTITGAGRLNMMYKIDTDTGKITGNSIFTNLLRYVFWSPRLIVSRFKTILGVPLFEFGGGVKRLGAVPEKVTAQWLEGYIKRTKSGIPYWAGIEMGGTAFFSTSRLAKKLRLTKYTNGEGWQIGNVTVPDIGLKLMLIPDYVAAITTATGALYGLKQHFEKDNIDGYVELDPSSTDFGKVALGPTKYDVLGGNGQSARFIVNMTTGKAKSSGTDIERVKYRADLTTRFIRSKSNPTIGVAWSGLSGETFTGEPFEFDQELWNLVLSMNAEDTYEIFANSLPSQGDELPYAKIGQNFAGGMLSTSGAGGQTYFTADDVIRSYFPTKDGTRYRYKDMEPYVQSLAKLFIPETKQMFGEVRSREKDIDEIMSIWLMEAEGTSRADLTAEELSKARLYLLQRMVTQDNNGNWVIQDNDIIKKAINTDTGQISNSTLGYALFQKVIKESSNFDIAKTTLYNVKYGVLPVVEDDDKEKSTLQKAKEEYHELAKQASARENSPTGFDSTIYDPLKKEWEDKYAPRISELRDENGNFTDEAIRAIENNPDILNKYVTEEWKYTIRNKNTQPIPIGIIYAINSLGINQDGRKSSYNKYTWEKFILPQILREKHMDTLNFTTMPSGMLDIPVQEDRKLTPNLLQKMVYYNVEINQDGTTEKGLPIE